MYATKQAHISTIKVGDTVFHDGHYRTVCKANIKHGDILGTTLFGDSYQNGKKLVTVVKTHCNGNLVRLS